MDERIGATLAAVGLAADEEELPALRAGLALFERLQRELVDVDLGREPAEGDDVYGRAPAA